MSTQAIAPTAGPASLVPGMLAASERVQRLQTLAAELRAGPSFAAALDAASTGQSGSAQPTTASLPQPGASAGSEPAGAGQYDQLIEAAAERNGLDPAVLHGLIQQESDFDPSSQSSAGAVGLTQLMPSTAASLGVTEPLNPAQSIEGGARYLAEMMQRFGGNVEDALAAYNAGPGAVQQYGGVPPYAETQQYVSKVLGYAAEYQQGAGAGTGADALTGTGASSPTATGALA